MSNLLKWALIVLASSGLLVAAFVWIYAPLRPKNLVAKYSTLRAETQSTHAATSQRAFSWQQQPALASFPLQSFWRFSVEI
jgi:hypothetical protein